MTAAIPETTTKPMRIPGFDKPQNTPGLSSNATMEMSRPGGLSYGMPLKLLEKITPTNT